MKFSIANLGRVRSADFEIKPLTVFIGKTNTNKTWTAYALYGILRALGFYRRSGFIYDQKLTPTCQAIDLAVEKIARQTADLLSDAAKAWNPAGADRGQRSFTLEVSREDVFVTAGLALDSEICIELGTAAIAGMLAIEPSLIDGALATLTYDAASFRSGGRIISLTFVLDKQGVNINWSDRDGGPYPLNTFINASEKLTSDFIHSQIAVYFRWMAYAVLVDTLAFPAERKAMSTLWAVLEPAQREQPLLKSTLNVPCLDFIRFLQIARIGQPRPATKIVTTLERGILNGRAEFSGSAESRVFTYKSEAGPSIQVHASASLVKALAALDLYLRQHPSSDAIVIDEPEMNAHPEAQLKLVELFAMLANSGRKVIVTTHSPYFLDHLNNLIEGSKLSGEAKAQMAQKLKLGEADAFISADKVSAYLFQENGVVTNLIEDGVIDIGSFSDESDYLTNLYSDFVKAGRREK